MYIPANTASGTYSGLVTIMKGDEVQILPVKIVVGGSKNTGQES